MAQRKAFGTVLSSIDEEGPFFDDADDCVDGPCGLEVTTCSQETEGRKERRREEGREVRSKQKGEGNTIVTE